jgi:hypothetical protein
MRSVSHYPVLVHNIRANPLCFTHSAPCRAVPAVSIFQRSIFYRSKAVSALSRLDEDLGKEGEWFARNATKLTHQRPVPLALINKLLGPCCSSIGAGRSNRPPRLN